jgi:KDO2-lipid IV(A) lauroyltransferase
LLAAFLAASGLPCSVIGRSPNYPALEKAIRKFRKEYGVDVIWSETAEAPRQIVSALREGRVVCALIDQDTKWKSEFSPFFGVEAASPIGAVSLALRTNVPIFSAFICRTGPLTHHARIQPLEYFGKDRAARKEILRTFNSRLEEMIVRDPSQYLWWHRRWRRRPGTDYGLNPELLPSTADYLAWLGRGTSAEGSATDGIVAVSGS